MSKDTKKMDDPIDPDERVSVGDIAERLITAASRIYDYHMGIAFGYDPPENFEKGNKDYQNRILEMVEPMIKDHEQTRNLDARTSADVIDLLKRGKITAKDAVSLLKVVSVRIEVEEEELKHTVKKQLIELLDGIDTEPLPEKKTAKKKGPAKRKTSVSKSKLT